jgi:hypothetical protein
LPDAARDFRAAIDEKSLVNDSAEMAGAAPAADEDDDAVVAAAELELDEELDDDELPQAATPTLAHTARAAKTGLRLSKFTMTSLLLSMMGTARGGQSARAMSQ